jgi:hypothetical protein
MIYCIVQFLSLSSIILSLFNHCLFMVTVRLTQKYDGNYLVRVTADCLNQFGLTEPVHKLTLFHLFSVLKTWQLHSMSMDNASNCDGTAKYLLLYILTFQGMASHG